MIERIDHVVITTTQPNACIAFYTGVMGMKLEHFGEGRRAFSFGRQKINLHVKGSEYEPKAHLPVSGSVDICFIADRPLDQVIERLAAANVNIIQGPVPKTGAIGNLRSVYVRDPDLNLIEISEYVSS